MTESTYYYLSPLSETIPITGAHELLGRLTTCHFDPKFGKNPGDTFSSRGEVEIMPQPHPLDVRFDNVQSSSGLLGLQGLFRLAGQDDYRVNLKYHSSGIKKSSLKDPDLALKNVRKVDGIENWIKQQHVSKKPVYMIVALLLAESTTWREDLVSGTYAGLRVEISPEGLTGGVVGPLGEAEANKDRARQGSRNGVLGSHVLAIQYKTVDKTVEKRGFFRSSKPDYVLSPQSPIFARSFCGTAGSMDEEAVPAQTADLTLSDIPRSAISGPQEENGKWILR